MRWRRGVGLALAFTLLACVAASARQDRQFAQAQQENAKRLRQYSWKSRTEVRKGGETKSTQLYLARSVIDYTSGELAVTTENFDHERAQP